MIAYWRINLNIISSQDKGTPVTVNTAADGLPGVAIESIGVIMLSCGRLPC